MCLLARKSQIPTSFLKIRLVLTFYRECLLPSFFPFYSSPMEYFLHLIFHKALCFPFPEHRWIILAAHFP